MKILFFIFYLIVSELTFMIASHQSEGLVKFATAGDFCHIGRILLVIPCIYYCGWIAGIILSLCTFFGVVHMTLGWILALPVFFVKNERQVYRLVNIECSAIIVVDIFLLIFTIVSFFVTPFKSMYKMFNSLSSVLILSVIAIFGFLLRIIVAKLWLKDNKQENMYNKQNIQNTKNHENDKSDIKFYLNNDNNKAIKIIAVAVSLLCVSILIYALIQATETPQKEEYTSESYYTEEILETTETTITTTMQRPLKAPDTGEILIQSDLPKESKLTINNSNCLCYVKLKDENKNDVFGFFCKSL